MKNTTRKGLQISIDENNFISQEKLQYGDKYYYKATRNDGVIFEFQDQLPNIPISLPEVRKEKLPSTIGIINSSTPKLLRAEDCPSAGGSFVVTKAAVDQFGAEKYKGEVFFTHKTSPGLVIKKGGIVIHDTKMEDMYKRR